ncbi:tetratricopeptide repeat protein [Marinilactibacillus psychrotolerans]|uniref:TPR-repeat-containing protein, putative component of Menaquinone-cytochrome C reductase n=1 Tax=Marinilactibacillus psychrotolerans 42ea TaxID=1255609 RepID=A0A1R4KDU3_9LACT|nr:tetratricopeptide repeat protein [Marinilactibacillus psychrotolerans]SJN42510.1 TPR-repeat-containing protein, putative component of Menaquinone-cytochrome C reductase [Marinilactibacillus psychrotolerans 42ea]
MSYSQKMVDALQNDQLSEAQEFLTRALKQDSIDDLYQLSDSLYQLGFLEQTKEILHHLLAQKKDDDEIKVNLAEIAIEEGNELEAIDWLQSIDKTSSVYPQALLVSADYYQVLDLPEVSEQKLLEAQSILENEPVILFALAELHFTMGKYAQAIREYEQLLTMGEENLAGIHLVSRLGSAYSALGDWENAIDYLEEAVEVDDTVDTLFQLGFTYFQVKEYQRANECLYKVKEMDHSYTSLYPYLAKGLDEENQLDKASEIIEEGLLQDKTNYQLYLIGAEVELKRSNEVKAEQYYKLALELDPDNDTISLQYTNFLLHQERYEETVDFVQKALTELDADPQLYWNLAVAQNELEEYAAARRAYDKAYPFFDTNIEFLKQYFFFLREEGQLDRSREVGFRYLEFSSDDLEIQEILNNEHLDSE